MTRVLMTGIPPRVRPRLPAWIPPEVEVVYLEREAPPEERRRLIASADLFLGYCYRDLLPELAGYRLVQLVSAGYDHLDLEAARRLKVPVANNGGANAVGVAEHTVLFMLAALKHLLACDALMRKGGWAGEAPEGEELEGRTIGLVGLGKIGGHVAKRLKGFDVTVLYHDVYRPEPAVEQELGVQYAALDDLLARSDIVSVHVPLLPSTRGMVDAAFLGKMKRGALFVNTSRGPVVKEAALYAALTGGHLKGACLDVFEMEPPDPQNPLFELPNVILSPHVAGNTAETYRKAVVGGFANVLRVVRGEKPQHVVPELRDLV